MIIGIDPGHGGRDPGATGHSGTREADINLDIALRLADRLKNQGHSTVLTRSTDVYVSLEDRAALLNQAQCDLVISNHVNASSNLEPHYISAYICKAGFRADKLAHHVLCSLVTATGWQDGGVRVANFYIIRKTIAPAVLVELGFISNPRQEKELNDPSIRDYLATAIAQGLSSYIARANN